MRAMTPRHRASQEDNVIPATVPHTRVEFWGFGGLFRHEIYWGSQRACGHPVAPVWQGGLHQKQTQVLTVPGLAERSRRWWLRSGVKGVLWQ